jgi:RHS repeat-associated protein
VNDEVVAKKNPDSTIHYIHTDHLGSTSVITNQSGQVVEKTTYEPYGEVKTGGTKSKFDYTGQEKDLETGLNYYDARYYDPHIHRFTQQDSIIQDVYDPQSLNRYSYVRNNPLRYTDPTGHFWGAALNIAKALFRPAVSLVAKVAPSIPIVGPLINKVASHPTTQQAVQKAQPVVNTVQNNPVAKHIINNIDATQVESRRLQQTVSTISNISSSVQKIHGNDLRSTAQTWGYKLVDKSSGVVKKIGESMHPGSRYPQKYLDANNLEMVRGPSGSKFDIRIWEHEQIGEYIFTHGGAHPVLNYQVERAVNVFR